MDEKQTIMEQLAEHFDPALVKVKPGRGKDGAPLSYISHGLVTQRLNDVYPDWELKTEQVHTYHDAGGALHCAGVTVALTINGVTRSEAGGPQRQSAFVDEIKNAYSDAIKRAAMRFGVALYIWDKLVDAEHDEDAHPEMLHEEPTRMEPRQRQQVEATHERIVAAVPPTNHEQVARKRIIGPPPRPCKWVDVVAALREDNWQFSSWQGDVIGRELEQMYDGEQVPSTKDDGGWWPSDIWAFVAKKQAAEIAEASFAVKA